MSAFIWRSSHSTPTMGIFPRPLRTTRSTASGSAVFAAVKAGLYTLAVIGVLASVVGAYYYLTIIKVMYFDEPVDSAPI